MPRRLTNDLLIGLVLAQGATGLAGWALPATVTGALALYDLHRALGIGTVALLGWKAAIALASLRRRLPRWPKDRSIVRGLLAAVALLGSLAIGLLCTVILGFYLHDTTSRAPRLEQLARELATRQNEAAFLDDASKLFNSSLDLSAVLQQVAQSTAQMLRSRLRRISSAP